MIAYITLDDYLGKWWNHPDATAVVQDNAAIMLDRVNGLLDEAFAHGIDLTINPKTNSYVSGTEYGGFRPQNCPQGAKHSSHKEGRGVDVYDPTGELDRWLTDKRLEAHGLYREHPTDTPGWAHLTDRSPGSNVRTFHP